MNEELEDLKIRAIPFLGCVISILSDDGKVDYKFVEIMSSLEQAKSFIIDGKLVSQTPEQKVQFEPLKKIVKYFENQRQ